MTSCQRFAIFVCMSDYDLTMLIIGIIIFIGVAVIVGKMLFDHYCDYKVYNRHIQNLCWPYRVVQLGGGKYGLQHYYVRHVPGNTDPDYSMLDAEWTLVKKFDYRADAMVAMDEAMATVIAERARVAYKEYKDAIKAAENDVVRILDYKPSYASIIEETNTIDCPSVDTSMIDRVCSPKFMSRPEIMAKKGLV